MSMTEHHQEPHAAGQASQITPDSLQAQIDQLREEAKELQPSILGALRTLVRDYRAWQENKREFPSSALLGLLFAYLRPRVILIFGSVGALTLAIVQIYLVVVQVNMMDAQNQLMKTQISLMEKQDRTARAEVAMSILPGLAESESLTPDKMAFLGAFGDLAFDAALPVLLQKNTLFVPTKSDQGLASLKLWLNCATVVVQNARKLSPRDAADVLVTMLRTSRDWLPYETVSPPSEWSLQKWGTQADLAPMSEEQRQGLTRFVYLISGFLEARQLELEHDIQHVSEYDRNVIIESIAQHEIFLHAESPHPALPHAHSLEIRALSPLCRAMTGQRYEYGLEEQISRGLKKIAAAHPTESVEDAVLAITQGWCGIAGRDEQRFPELAKTAAGSSMVK
jgi:hypothetical protein